jgi:serine/threonine-protein kinase HipA
MKKLSVYYSGWGEDLHLAELAESGRDTLFEYTDEAKARGLELSPFRFPLEGIGTISRPTRSATALVGFINDALPDGWGMRLIDRALEARGRRPSEATPLDRLAIIGDNAFGALRFVPPDAEAVEEKDLDLLALARETQRFVAGHATDALPELLRVGGSPQGARPKAAVWYDLNTGRISTVEFKNAAPWLVKFPAASEHPEVCAIETVYSQLAAECGIEMPPTFAIELPDAGSAAFGIARFDRRDSLRVPIQSFAAMLDVDFSNAHADYRDLLMLVKRITRDQREVEKLFRRCVFNVVYNNRDDHLKNFAFQLNQDGNWGLTPAYDLTFCYGPGGEHWTTVKGAGKAIDRDHLVALAEDASIKKGRAEEILEEVISPVSKWLELSSTARVAKDTQSQIDYCIRTNASRMRKL